MSRGSRVPKGQRSGSRALPTGWGRLAPVVGLCAVAMISAVMAFGGRGGVEAASGAACVTDAVPGEFESWSAFFRRYPFDDAFVKARIEAVNGPAPGEVVTIPLAGGASCGQAAEID